MIAHINTCVTPYTFLNYTLKKLMRRFNNNIEASQQKIDVTPQIKY